MNKLTKILKFTLMLMTLWSIVVLFAPEETYKDFGSISWNLLIVVMLVRPLRDLFPRFFLFSFVWRFRRELGILVWIFWITHVIWYFIMMQYSLDIFSDLYNLNYKSFIFWWILWTISSIPPLITSNRISSSFLWKKWKTIQKLAYFMFIFVSIHIFLIKWEIDPLIFIWLWISLLIIAFIKKKKKSTIHSDSNKWLCIPCWYIYDESVWDPDSWIKPWTKFEDIPDNWRCPVCWVWKSDFMLLKSEIKTNESEIIWLNYLTNDVIELKVDLKKDLEFISWQFLNFAFEDKMWKFNRNYSIANKEWTIFTFLIKAKADWRAWILLRNKKIWDKIIFSQVYWNFTLQNTKNPKVFIATWTWLSPIVSMIRNNNYSQNNKLFFWVRTKWDLFYEEVLKSFNNLEINIFLSKEEVEWYNYGRMDLSKYNFDLNTEFYICWNPQLVEETLKFLEEKWYKNVYSEKFN